MEKILLQTAKRLLAYDEASLMNLWEKYAVLTQNFQPTKAWEEATVVFCLIQAIRFKNQLFNYNWAKGIRPEDMEHGNDLFTFDDGVEEVREEVSKAIVSSLKSGKNLKRGRKSANGIKRGKVLAFNPDRKKDK